MPPSRLPLRRLLRVAPCAQAAPSARVVGVEPSLLELPPAQWVVVGPAARPLVAQDTDPISPQYLYPEALPVLLAVAPLCRGPSALVTSPPGLCSVHLALGAAIED